MSQRIIQIIRPYFDPLTSHSFCQPSQQSGIIRPAAPVRLLCLDPAQQPPKVLEDGFCGKRLLVLRCFRRTA